MRLLYTKPKIKNMSQGARIAFVRQFRLMTQDNVSDKLELTGECKRRTMTRYEKGNRNLKEERVREIAKPLHSRLVKYKENHLYFIKDFNVPFDDNLSERDLRIFKTKTKISGGFRSIEAAQDFVNVLSIIKTSIKKI